MAEWSKALRLGRSIFGCVGSNPTPVTFFSTNSQETDINKKLSIKLKWKQFSGTPGQKSYQENFPRGRMAEWSKALCSGRSIFGCVGSNPTPVTFFYQFTRDRYPQELRRSK